MFQQQIGNQCGSIYVPMHMCPSFSACFQITRFLTIWQIGTFFAWELYLITIYNFIFICPSNKPRRVLHERNTVSATMFLFRCH